MQEIKKAGFNRAVVIVYVRVLCLLAEKKLTILDILGWADFSWAYTRTYVLLLTDSVSGEKRSNTNYTTTKEGDEEDNIIVIVIIIAKTWFQGSSIVATQP